jgi:hypothetical protein
VRRQHFIGILCACATAAISLTFESAAAQGRQEAYTATASVSGPNGTVASAMMTAVVRSFSTDADRDAVIAAVKKGGTAARDLLASRPDVGSIQVGTKQTPVKYAYARTIGRSRLITLVTAEPIHFLGGDLPDAKPKAGYDLGLVVFDVDPAEPGHGELAPAAKVKVDAQNAIVIEDYGAEAVRLSNVVRK